MKVLVTGGSGFIGRNITRQCRERGWETVSFDTESEGDADNHVTGSVLDFDLLRKAMKGCDYAFHLAATTSPPQFEEAGNNGYEVNVMGTFNTLQAAYENGVMKVVLASSSAIYGDMTEAANEDMLPNAYKNAYPVTKKVNEITAKFFSSSSRVETVALRYFNTYGIGENTKAQYASVIWRFVRALQAGEVPEIYGDGRQSRDFIYVEDTARASILAMEKGIPGEAYNIGTGVTTSFNDIYRIVAEEMHSDIKPRYVANPLKNYQYFTQADITKARRDLGFTPEFDIRSGVRKMIQAGARST
ncbi:MAG: NAD-dependent epimerase/dehydratase family protein [Candidatus Thermoplasmatota archaeon]|nr:NAD-dependent epimerase/dehydratase family protein [Candidatus Thermoplasmatota archaeon]